MPRGANIKKPLSGKGTAIAVIVTLVAVSAAYGARWGLSGPAGHHRHHSPIAGVPIVKKRIPRPRITAHPESQTSSTTATFRVSDRARRVKLECHLDSSPWSGCGGTVNYASVDSGRHRFYARATRRGVGNSRIASFTWKVELPMTPVNAKGLPFAIVQSGPPPVLYPGAGPSPVLLTLANLNPDQIQVTSLAVAVTGSPAGCDPNVNVRVKPSSVSSADPLVMAGSSTLTLTPAQSPTIELVESGKNQDACRAGSFSLSFRGSAHG